MVDIHTIYVNKKTNYEYFVHAIGIDCTNTRDGSLMVRYTAIGGDGSQEFYREIEEFNRKFEKKRFKDVRDTTKKRS